MKWTSLKVSVFIQSSKFNPHYLLMCLFSLSFLSRWRNSSVQNCNSTANAVSGGFKARSLWLKTLALCISVKIYQFRESGSHLYLSALWFRSLIIQRLPLTPGTLNRQLPRTIPFPCPIYSWNVGSTQIPLKSQTFHSVAREWGKWLNMFKHEQVTWMQLTYESNFGKYCFFSEAFFDLSSLAKVSLLCCHISLFEYFFIMLTTLLLWLPTYFSGPLMRFKYSWGVILDLCY